MIEISVLSTAHYLSKNDFSLDTTDFQMLNLPAPDFKGGQSDDVILLFNDITEIANYSDRLANHKIIVPLDDLDFLKNKKIERIQKSIGLYFQFIESSELLRNRTFVELRSKIKYKFIGEDTLSTSTNVRVRYSVKLRNDKVVLDTDPKIFSEHLEVILNNSDQMELLGEYSGNIKLILQEE